jgi:hypothetical protein
MNISDYNRISLFIADFNAHVIVEYNVDELFEDNASLLIVTILPVIKNFENVNRIFYF